MFCITLSWLLVLVSFWMHVKLLHTSLSYPAYNSLTNTMDLPRVFSGNLQIMWQCNFPMALCRGAADRQYLLTANVTCSNVLSATYTQKLKKSLRVTKAVCRYLGNKARENGNEWVCNNSLREDAWQQVCIIALLQCTQHQLTWKSLFTNPWLK